MKHYVREKVNYCFVQKLSAIAKVQPHVAYIVLSMVLLVNGLLVVSLLYIIMNLGISLQLLCLKLVCHDVAIEPVLQLTPIW